MSRLAWILLSFLFAGSATATIVGMSKVSRDLRWNRYFADDNQTDEEIAETEQNNRKGVIITGSGAGGMVVTLLITIGLLARN